MFKGSIPALVTPMRADGSLDFDAWDRLLDFHVAEGTDGVVVGGHDRRIADARVRGTRGTGASGEDAHRRAECRSSRAAAPTRPRRASNCHAPWRRRAPTRCCWSRRITTGRPRKGCSGISRAIADAVDMPVHALQRARAHRLRPAAGDGRAAVEASADRRHQGSDGRPVARRVDPATTPGPASCCSAATIRRRPN